MARLQSLYELSTAITSLKRRHFAFTADDIASATTACISDLDAALEVFETDCAYSFPWLPLPCLQTASAWTAARGRWTGPHGTTSSSLAGSGSSTRPAPRPGKCAPFTNNMRPCRNVNSHLRLYPGVPWSKESGLGWLPLSPCCPRSHTVLPEPVLTSHSCCLSRSHHRRSRSRSRGRSPSRSRSPARRSRSRSPNTPHGKDDRRDASRSASPAPRKDDDSGRRDASRSPSPRRD